MSPGLYRGINRQRPDLVPSQGTRRASHRLVMLRDTQILPVISRSPLRMHCTFTKNGVRGSADSPLDGFRPSSAQARLVEGLRVDERKPPSAPHLTYAGIAPRVEPIVIERASRYGQQADA